MSRWPLVKNILHHTQKNNFYAINGAIACAPHGNQSSVSEGDADN